MYSQDRQGPSCRTLATTIETENIFLVELLPESDNAFQITLEQPASQKAIVNIPGKEGGVIPIGDTKIAFSPSAYENGLSVKGNSITSIHFSEKVVLFFTLDFIVKTRN